MCRNSNSVSVLVVRIFLPIPKVVLEEVFEALGQTNFGCRGFTLAQAEYVCLNLFVDGFRTFITNVI